MKMAELSKSGGMHRGVMLGEPSLAPGKKQSLCLPGLTKGESHPQCLNSNLYVLHRNLRPAEKKKSSGAVYQSAYIQNIAVCPWGISSHPLPWPPATA